MDKKHDSSAILEERDGIVVKKCTKCSEWVPLDGYYKDKRRLGGVRSSCKNCFEENRKTSGYMAMYRERNKEYFKEKATEWRRNNPDRVRQTKQMYYLENKEKILEQIRKYQSENKEHLMGKVREWQSKNSDLLKLYTQNRRARKVLLPNTLTKEQVNTLLEVFGGCALTGDVDNLHLDHVIPLVTGHGGTIFENTVPVRSDLNLSKHTSNIFEWFPANRQRFELSQERFDNLIAWLASANAMTVKEYRDYVYWCHANPRDINELEAQ